MKTKYAVLAALVIASSALTRAQAPNPQQANVIHATNHVKVQDLSVSIEAAEGDYNRSTGQWDFVGPVTVRTQYKPSTVEVQAPNFLGAPLPPSPFKPVVMHFRGNFEITIGTLILRADEADVDSKTGEMELRGNVRLTHAVVP